MTILIFTLCWSSSDRGALLSFHILYSLSGFYVYVISLLGIRSSPIQSHLSAFGVKRYRLNVYSVCEN